ncbi:MAG: exodeoxyribonuclease VII large subunit, partial [Rhodoplanes sp.]
MAVPVRAELIVRVESLGSRAFACWRRGHENRRAELRSAVRALPSAEALLALPRQRLDAAAARLPRALIANAHLHRADFSRIAGGLNRQLLQARLAREGERVTALSRRAAHCTRVLGERRRERLAAAAGRLAVSLRTNMDAHRVRIARGQERAAALFTRSERAVRMLVHRHAGRVERAGQLLEALSYQSVLSRGFALVRGPDARPLFSASAVTSGLRLEIEFADGRVGATADGKVTPKRTRRDRSGGPDQGSLF